MQFYIVWFNSGEVATRNLLGANVSNAKTLWFMIKGSWDQSEKKK